MIYLYSGTPGSGKSMHQAEDIYNVLRFGGVVLANYPIHTELVKNKTGYFFQYDMMSLKPQQLKDFSIVWFKDPHHVFREGILKLYIDECQLIFNSRSWDRQDRKEWLDFFTQHRKYGYDIYLIAQNDRMLDRQIRALIEHESLHRKLSQGDWRFKFIALFLGYKNTYACSEFWYPLKLPIGVHIHHVKKKYYKLFDSYKDFKFSSVYHVDADKEAEIEASIVAEQVLNEVNKKQHSKRFLLS